MSISRRGFLGGLAGGAGLLATKPASAGHKHFDGYEGRYGLLHDTTLCVGCRSCETACHETNKLPSGPLDNPAVFDKTRRTTDKDYTVVNRYVEAKDGQPAIYRKHQCMHCNEPCCASVCFVKAFKKTPEGPVLYDPSVCVGCRYCVMVCPYDALAYEYDDPTTPRVVRCTMCYDRIKENKQPACAEACPTGAITFGRRDELVTVARERMRKYPERYVDHLFGEHEFGGTSWLVLAGVNFGQLGLPEGESHTPLPEMASGFLGVVPLVLTIYPGLLGGFYAFSKRKEHLAAKKLKETLDKALADADAETRTKLNDAAKKATKDKEKAVEGAVKRALAQAAKEAEEKAKTGKAEADNDVSGKEVA